MSLLKFDDSLLKTFLKISNEVVAEIGSGDDLSRTIYDSYGAIPRVDHGLE